MGLEEGWAPGSKAHGTSAWPPALTTPVGPALVDCHDQPLTSLPQSAESLRSPAPTTQGIEQVLRGLAGSLLSRY